MAHDNGAQAQIDRDNVTKRKPATKHSNTFFQLPPAVKRVFDQFPLVTYDANELPQRALVQRQEHVLHVFTTERDARSGRPSYNPGCLKWQTYLKTCGLRFQVVPSSNHASPSGALPFLQPAGSDAASIAGVDPISSNKLRKWLTSQTGLTKHAESMDVRYEAYASLLDSRVRKAWLFQLYLSPQNADLVHRLYVAACSSQKFVQMAIARGLCAAAEAELVKSAGKNVISALDIMRDAEEAFGALSVLLGDDRYFFGLQQPGLFDASVFAYTYPIMDESLEWGYNPLEEALSQQQNLVRHRNRMSEMYD